MEGLGDPNLWNVQQFLDAKEGLSCWLQQLAAAGRGEGDRHALQSSLRSYGNLEGYVLAAGATQPQNRARLGRRGRGLVLEHFLPSISKPCGNTILTC